MPPSPGFVKTGGQLRVMPSNLSPNPAVQHINVNAVVPTCRPAPIDRASTMDLRTHPSSTINSGDMAANKKRHPPQSCLELSGR